MIAIANALFVFGVALGMLYLGYCIYKKDH